MKTINNYNYYSLETDRKYMSYSQYKSFIKCAYQAMGYLDGKITYPKSDSMLIGSMVDAFIEGTYEDFLYKNKDELWTGPDRFGSSEPTGLGVFRTIQIIFAAVMLIIGMANINNIMTGFINPEYGAIQDVIEMVRDMQK